MSDKKTRDVSAEYRRAERVADKSFNPGTEVIDLPAIRRACFVQGYAQALIDLDVLREVMR